MHGMWILSESIPYTTDVVHHEMGSRLYELGCSRDGMLRLCDSWFSPDLWLRFFDEVDGV